MLYGPSILRKTDFVTLPTTRFAWSPIASSPCAGVAAGRRERQRRVVAHGAGRCATSVGPAPGGRAPVGIAAARPRGSSVAWKAGSITGTATGRTARDVASA